MYYYSIAGLVLQSCFQLLDYKDFACEPSHPDVTLEVAENNPPPGIDRKSGSIVHRRLQDGWFYHSSVSDKMGLFVNDDYTQLSLLGSKDGMIPGCADLFIRIALECRFIRKGFVSLHAAAVENRNEAFAFSGPSGIGKSTRSVAWTEAFSTKLINGDRPLIDTHRIELYGVPWDGKERCFRNVHYPLKAICEVRRSESVYVREMSLEQRRKLLLRQCFIPMWDTETAAIQMININRLAVGMQIVRVFSGPTTEDVRALYNALQEHKYLKEEPDMKAKPGFVLRNVVDEYILMPKGENIGQFNGTVLFNEVSAFVWEKLQNPMSKEDLLKAILDEYEVDKATASADLDKLLDTLRGYEVIEDD